MIKASINIKHVKFYFWTGTAYLFLCVFIDLARFHGSFISHLFNNIWQTVYVIAVIYLFFEYIIPGLSRKRIIRSLFLLAVLFLLFSVGLYAWRQIGILLHIHTPFITYASCSKGVGDQFGKSIFAVIFFGILRHTYNYRKLRLDAQQLKIEKQEAELNYLKSQTNPHFLFNTLNNIYSLSRDKSDLAPESILRLSKILRYMLYETAGEYIAIEQELKIISDYIELEKLRYDESLSINFNYDIEDMKQSLPPLLLIPLVENAFKHGASETRSRPFVDIHLSVKHRQLILAVKNSIDETSSSQKVKENIGLSNLKRQLELLYTDYDFSFGPGESEFTATLKINLASHV
jgi:two-component system LytT family sensor kinase